MKILCVYLCDFIDRDDYYLSLMPVGIVSIASFLEDEGHEVILANFSGYGYLKAAIETASIGPDAVAISIFSFNRTESLKYITELKRRYKRAVIIAGGQHPTFLAEQLISRYSEIDFIVSGEGENSIKKIIDSKFSISEKIISSERIADIDSIPAASSFSGKTVGINPNEQYKYIITSRGCPSSCTYCSSPSFWQKKVTCRSAGNILNELRYIRKRYGIIYFSIRDDNFTLNKKRVLEFCSLLEKSGLYMMWNCQARVDTIDEEMLVAMKRSGLEHIQFGVESGSEKILKAYDKHITVEKIRRAATLTRNTGVYLSFYLMAGMTGETESDIDETKTVLAETLPHDVIVSPVAYYPGTKIYRDSVKQKKISDNIWFDTDSNGIYLVEPEKTSKQINGLLKFSSGVAKKAEYVKKDFKVHRVTAGDCWMNNIIESDYHIGRSDIKNAVAICLNLINKYPDNIWGYLRLAEIYSENNPVEALKILNTASKIVPNYYGIYFMDAQINYNTGNINSAKLSITSAIKYNSYDPAITELYDIIYKK